MTRIYKKLTATIIGVLLPILNTKLNIGIGMPELGMIETILLGFIVGTGFEDMGKARVQREYDILFDRAESYTVTQPPHTSATSVNEIPN